MIAEQLASGNGLGSLAIPSPLTIAIAGNPNSGKTSLFNALTGMRQKVANYPGVTVESKVGLWSLSPEVPPAQLIDLPGLYSIEATSVDEQIARDILLGRASTVAKVEALVIVVDATNLMRNLYLATQLIETGIPAVVALTMFDTAQRTTVIDVEKLSEALGIPVVPVIAKQGLGIQALEESVVRAVAKPGSKKPGWTASAQAPLSLSAVKAAPQRWQEPLLRRYEWIEQLVSDVVDFESHGRHGATERIDAFVTHKILGPILLLLVMLLVFQTIFAWSNLPMNLIDRAFHGLAEMIRVSFPPGVLTDLLVDGIVAGVGSVLVFVPQILLLFLFITLLEDSGYMARAAFLMDRVMRSCGLHGKAFMPLLSSFACAVPGIMATRTIENSKDRFAAIMIAPFMSCSARLPLYTLAIASFFAGQKILGFLSLGAVIILGMYVLGVIVAIVVAWILKHTLLHAPPAPFVMELPPYRVPSVANVVQTILMRLGIFIKRAGTVILAISILLWALAAFPRSENRADRGGQVRNSYAGRAGYAIEPIIAPLGFDWRIGIALISSFAARETVISTLSIVYNVGNDSAEDTGTLIETMRRAKRPDATAVWTPLVALSLMVFFVLACQCMSTVAVVRRETNSWRWPLFMVSYMLVLAYVGSLITYQGGRLLGFS